MPSPTPHYPPDPDALALAAATVSMIRHVTPALIEEAAEAHRSRLADGPL